MNGINNYKQIPVIEEKGEMVITKKKKAEVSKIHSSENLAFRSF